MLTAKHAPNMVHKFNKKVHIIMIIIKFNNKINNSVKTFRGKKI